MTEKGEDGEHPIVYYSRVMNACERNYTVTAKECLRMIEAIKKS